MAFYVTTVDGTEKAAGRRFDTLDAAIVAAKKSIRITSKTVRSGFAGLCVMEEIPGRHIERATVYPDRVETKS